MPDWRSLLAVDVCDPSDWLPEVERPAVLSASPDEELDAVWLPDDPEPVLLVGLVEPAELLEPELEELEELEGLEELDDGMLGDEAPDDPDEDGDDGELGDELPELPDEDGGIGG